MRTKFPGYFRMPEQEIQILWSNALFILDANILLNIYRYSKETQEEIFKILERIKDRIWIPHQAAKEFFSNRTVVIGQQCKAYDDAGKSLTDVVDKFKNTKRHPFISRRLLTKIDKVVEEVKQELDQSKTFHEGQVLNDDILKKIENIFSGKVGDEFEQEKIQDLVKEGEDRYKRKIPPGYNVILPKYWTTA